MVHPERKMEIMISQERIASRVAEMGRQITADNQGKELIIVAVLKGSFLFVADLVRHIDLPLSVDFLGLASYGEETTSSGVVEITKDLSRPIAGQHVIVVEDIVDTGLTMRYLLDNFETRRPASIQVCTLLHKPANQECEVPIDYTGFTIENHFVVGYGLDLAERYRNLPYIATVLD